MHIEKVETIFSDGRHNAFTNIDFWKGKYYVARRSAPTHASPGEPGWGDDLETGVIRLLESDGT